MVSLKILVADDMPENLLILQHMLQQEGHIVQTAADGEEAVEAARLERFDLILLDLQMPIIDGEEAAKIIRAMPGPQRLTPIVAVTASTDFLDSGCTDIDGILSKPISRGALTGLIDDLQTRWRPAAKPKARIRRKSLNASNDVDFKMILDIRSSIGENYYKLMATAFSERCKTTCADLKISIDNGDVAKIRRSTHSLAGLIGQFGLRTASVAARKLSTTVNDDACLAAAPGLIELVEESLKLFANLESSNWNVADKACA